MSKAAKVKTVHMIGHAHIDPVWRWRWPEGFQEVRGTFQSALDRIDEDKDVIFIASSLCFYKWIENIAPEMFRKIKLAIRAGRWSVVGGWWIEPDCNIPSGESLVRQGLYGKRYAAEKLGVDVKDGFNPDSFGHSCTLPQIFSKLGIENYCFMKPTPAQMSFPPDRNMTTFRWRSKDGSEILTSIIPHIYGNITRGMKTDFDLQVNWPYHLPGLNDVMSFYGVIDHGGGPTKQALRDIRELQRQRNDLNIIFSDPGRYFAAISKVAGRLPVFKGSIRHYAAGCYSSQSELKKLNRTCEHMLLAAERWATVAATSLGEKFPREALDEAWESLLFNQFHDILAGTSIPDACQDAIDELGLVRHKGRKTANRAIQKLLSRIDTKNAPNAVVVLNPLPWPRKAVVSLEVAMVEDAAGDRTYALDYQNTDMVVKDDSGRSVPSIQGPGNFEHTIGMSFTADVPPLGYRVYTMQEGRRPKASLKSLSYSAGRLENRFYRLKFNRRSGAIDSLYDKINKVEVANKLNLAVAVDDPYDSWGHFMDRFGKKGLAFGNAKISLETIGETHATVRIATTAGRSDMTQMITIYRDSPGIDCSVVLNWAQKAMVLKLIFDTKISGAAAVADKPYGWERCEADHEECCQKWVDLGGTLAGRKYGLAVINDSKYGFDCYGGTLRMTAVRSPIFVHSDWHRPASKIQYMDLGTHRFSYRLLPHRGSWKQAHVPQMAWEFNEPLVTYYEHTHSGDLPRHGSFLSVSPANVICTVFKPACDGDGLVIRCYEAESRRTEAKITAPLMNRTFRVRFEPNEIKTLLLDRRTRKISEVNLLEMKRGNLTK